VKENLVGGVEKMKADFKPKPNQLLGQDVWMDELEKWYSIRTVEKINKRSTIVKLEDGTILELRDNKRGGFIVMRVSIGEKHDD